MKKQILTLTMCLALTATSALADGTKAVVEKTVPQTKAVINSKSPSASLVEKTIEKPRVMMREEAKKRIEEKRAKERELMYTALALSTEQKIKAEELDAKTRIEAEELFKSVRLESKKLRDLKAKKASFISVYKQNMKLNSAKNKINKYFASSRKSFEDILTKEQKAKFKLINDAKRQEMEQFKKAHKLQGRKGHFGPKSMGPSPSEIERPMVVPAPTVENKK